MVFKDYSEQLEQERDEWKKQAIVAQEMLAQIIQAFGGEVFITKESVQNGIAPNKAIEIQEEFARDGWWLRLVETNVV